MSSETQFGLCGMLSVMDFTHADPELHRRLQWALERGDTPNWQTGRTRI